MDRVIVIGGPGPAVSIANAIRHASQQFGTEVEFTGILNDSSEGGTINNIPVVGKLSDASAFQAQGYKFIFTIYKIGGQPHRIQLFNSLGIRESSLYTFVHPLAYVAPDADLAPGVVIMPNANISHGTKIGLGTLIMSNAYIGHDTIVGKHCFMSATSCTGSYITVGEGVWVGFNATIRGRQKLGQYAAVGIGSVVVSDIPDEELWIGNPARFHKKVTAPIRY
ncbi:MAG: hypothetical protein M9904_11270 [Chitinophagaceae bacterium]|nr:hypothetical protein [Chitinophagaceae bacterium]